MLEVFTFFLNINSHIYLFEEGSNFKSIKPNIIIRLGGSFAKCVVKERLETGYSFS